MMQSSSDQAFIKAMDENTSLRNENARLREVLEPFAIIAEFDISDAEADSDFYRPMDARCAVGGVLTVGHLRAARKALERTNG